MVPFHLDTGFEAAFGAQDARLKLRKCSAERRRTRFKASIS
jgi:hypothetical protein